MTFRRVVAVTGIAVVITGCGSTTTRSAESSGSPTGPVSGSAAAPARLTVNITIADGTLTPTNAQLSAQVGQPIVLQVSSDAADELHVHSVPAHEFEVRPGQAQRFEFTVAVPGTVDVELHHLNRTVASIQVRP